DTWNSLNPEWYRLGEWLHQKLGHTGKAALYFAAQRKVILTECPQCKLRLQTDHPAKVSPLYISKGKPLWSTWQINYISPLKPSSGILYKN
uniref:Uncharacterized protein n=1 Tax=Falco tinnunculus TaxID=100819 RepID=A0A8C4U3K2_FALTI